MRAVEVVDPGPRGSLRVVEVEDPVAGLGEVVVDVAAAGVNRADTSQRRGGYPPPPGASEYPGLECAGSISAIGPGVTGWAVGDEVCALLAGGGYATRVAVPAGQLLRRPSALSTVEAAALPEAAATVWVNLFHLGGLREGETVLVHGGSSGIGTTAIQLAVARGARVLVTAGSSEKLAACEALGATGLIDHRTEDFVERAKTMTGRRGVDVVLDIVGADYVARNLEVLAPDGRLVVVGIQSGAEARVDLRVLLRKRVRVTGSMLRSRPVEQKAAIIDEVREHVLPEVERGALRPLVHAVLPLEQAGEAHRLLESSTHIGKVVLTT